MPTGCFSSDAAPRPLQMPRLGCLRWRRTPLLMPRSPLCVALLHRLPMHSLRSPHQCSWHASQRRRRVNRGNSRRGTLVHVTGRMSEKCRRHLPSPHPRRTLGCTPSCATSTAALHLIVEEEPLCVLPSPTHVPVWCSSRRSVLRCIGLCCVVLCCVVLYALLCTLWCAVLWGMLCCAVLLCVRAFYDPTVHANTAKRPPQRHDEPA